MAEGSIGNFLPRDPAWQQASPPNYRGGRVVAQHEQTWGGLCAVLLDVRAEGEIHASLQADFTRVCITLEEVGGPFEITDLAIAGSRPPAASQAISVIPRGMRAVGHASTLRFMRQLLLQLDGPTLSTWLDERIDLDAALAGRLMVAEPRLLQLGTLIAKECASGPARDPLYRDGLVVALLGALANPSQSAPAPGVTRGGLAPWQVRRVTEFLMAHLPDSVDIAALAALARLSKSHFSRAFKASTGLSPHRWLMHARIARGREMLIEGELPVAEIAMAVGFADQAHFTRTFGCIVGTSPRAWQRARCN